MPMEPYTNAPRSRRIWVNGSGSLGTLGGSTAACSSRASTSRSRAEPDARTNCHGCTFEFEGACIASSRASRTSWRGTGLSGRKSRVERRSSMVCSRSVIVGSVVADWRHVLREAATSRPTTLVAGASLVHRDRARAHWGSAPLPTCASTAHVRLLPEGQGSEIPSAPHLANPPLACSFAGEGRFCVPGSAHQLGTCVSASGATRAVLAQRSLCRTRKECALEV